MMDSVLMFHDVYRDSFSESGFQSAGANHYKITEALFVEQLDSLSVLPLTWTFDDGGASSYSVIAPLLEQYNLKGHFFIVTDRIGSEGFLSTNQIRDLYNRGHIIGSHSRSHPENLKSLSYEERKKEWTESVLLLNSLIESQINENDIAVLRELGITKVYTSSLLDDYVDNTIHVLGRIGIDPSFSSRKINRILSGGCFSHMLILRQRLLSALKCVLGHHYLKLKSFIRTLEIHKRTTP